MVSFVTRCSCVPEVLRVPRAAAILTELGVLASLLEFL